MCCNWPEYTGESLSCFIFYGLGLFVYYFFFFRIIFLEARQYTWAVWSIFVDIQSARCIDALFGVTGISGYLIAISENTWSFDYFWYSVG